MSLGCDQDYTIHAYISKEESLIIHGCESEEVIVQIAQQFSWISAACSASPFETADVAYCVAKIGPQSLQIPSIGDYELDFHISLHYERLQQTERPCWIPIFNNATIAQGFPIPDRLGEVGLEISLPLMSELIGACHFVDFDGGLVLKGHSAMLIPTRKGSDVIQWHLVTSEINDSEARLSYAEGVSRCPTRLLLDSASLSDLLTKRAIVGWHSNTRCMLGQPAMQYCNIHYSKAPDKGTPITIHGASLGFQQFGVAQVDFALGIKDGNCHIRQKRPYERLVFTAEKVPVLLYDTGEKRSWLVSAAEVMLHIAQHRHWMQPYLDGKINFQFCDNPRDSLLRNANLKLSEHEDYSFRTMIVEIWSIFEALLDHRFGRATTGGYTISKLFKDNISGYEFKDVVDEVPMFKLKQENIQKTSGGWPTLVQDIDALVLFADGYEDVLRPKDDVKGICHKWKTLPKGKDFLATSIRMLRLLFDKAGCPLDRTYLTSTKLQWHRGESLLFEHCSDPSAWVCSCERLQQIVSSRILGDIVPPGKLEDHGAVIFGSTHQSGVAHKIIASRSCDGLYSHPNLDLQSTHISETGSHTSAESTISSISNMRTTMLSSLESRPLSEKDREGLPIDWKR